MRFAAWTWRRRRCEHPEYQVIDGLALAWCVSCGELFDWDVRQNPPEERP